MRVVVAATPIPFACIGVEIMNAGSTLLRTAVIVDFGVYVINGVDIPGLAICAHF
jgi:hypothetical protein